MLKSDGRPPCRRCKYRHHTRNLFVIPEDLPCTECVPLPPEGFQPGRVGYTPEPEWCNAAEDESHLIIRVPCRTKGCRGTVTAASRSGLCVVCSARATNRRHCPLCGRSKAKHRVLCDHCAKQKRAAGGRGGVRQRRPPAKRAGPCGGGKRTAQKDKSAEVGGAGVRS